MTITLKILDLVITSIGAAIVLFGLMGTPFNFHI